MIDGEIGSENPVAHLNEKEEYLYRLRHSTAHVLAQAVQELFPEAKKTIGPPIEDGFYYDFDCPHKFTPEDLKQIEKRMREIVKENVRFMMSTLDSAESKKFWDARGEKYKVELIESFSAPTVTHCTHGNFVDLCRGRHVDSTQEIRHFKLLKVAGAYWRGDEKREQLQRIYGTAWPTKEELDEYLKLLEEAKKRDHRDLGQKLDLFSMQPQLAGPGLIFWHPKGTLVREMMETYLRDRLKKENYQFVATPHVARVNLWQTSGHWDFYKENMFPAMEIENQPFVVKPMNCPGHILIFKSRLRSYRDLPMRIAEFGTVYRFERSGVMHGLMRVRGFTQDDAHLFCRMDQLEEECVKTLSLIMEILRTFGFNDFDLKLSTRPEKFTGTEENWAKAQEALKKALETLKLPYTVDPGEGVFYGPKIDLKIRDSLKREWQCSTVQVDFNLPEKFDVTYRDSSGGESRVVMVHRALLGSLERFFGILIEHYAGLFPLWLAPIQAVIMTITEDQTAFAQEVFAKLQAAGIRAELDDRHEKIGHKVREASIQKIPYQLAIGAREAEAGTVSVRLQNGQSLGVMSVDDFVTKAGALIQSKSLTYSL